MNKIQQGLSILREEGIKQFIQKTTSFVYCHSIRDYLPMIGYHKKNEVETYPVRLLDPFLASNKATDSPNAEGGIVSAHEKFTEPGDLVNIVGGGNGVTAVRAAQIVGDSGKVTVYEGGKESIDELQKIIKINNVEDKIYLKHAIVGKERDVYGGDSTFAKIISPEDLPECDVLELDCEGSEIDILGEMNILPRIIIVELHPYNFSEEPYAVETMLSKCGYEIVYRVGHDGKDICKKDFYTLLEHSNNKKEFGQKSITHNRGRNVSKSGAQWPVVMVARHCPELSQTSCE